MEQLIKHAKGVVTSFIIIFTVTVELSIAASATNASHLLSNRPYHTALYMYDGMSDEIQPFENLAWEDEGKLAGDVFQLQFQWKDDEGTQQYDYVRMDTGSSFYRLVEGSNLDLAIQNFCDSQTQTQFSCSLVKTAGEKTIGLTLQWNSGERGNYDTKEINDHIFIEFTDETGQLQKIGILDQYRHGTDESTASTGIQYSYNSHQTFPFNTQGIFQPTKNSRSNYTWIDYNTSRFYLIRSSNDDFFTSSDSLLQYPYFSGSIREQDQSYVVSAKSNFTTESDDDELMMITIDTGGGQNAIVLGADYTFAGTLSYTNDTKTTSCTGVEHATYLQFSNAAIYGASPWEEAITDMPVYFPADYGMLGCDIVQGSDPNRVWNYLALEIDLDWQNVFKTYYVDNVLLGNDSEFNYKWYTAAFTFMVDSQKNSMAFGWGCPSRVKCESP